MEFTPTEQATIRTAVAALVASPLLRSSARQRRFLEYIVDETLNGRGARVNGYALGIEVFDRASDFDPTTDAIVRVEAGRLRSKLVEYSSGLGAGAAVEVALPRGHYVPEFRFRAARETGLPASATPLKSDQTHRLEHRTAIAVLPLQNLNGGPERDYFCDGLADDLITALSKITGFTVLTRFAAFRFKGQNVEPQAIAESLNVDYLLMGSVRYAGPRLRVSLQLIDGTSARALWSERYDDAVENVFEVQDHVVAAVATFLKDALTPTEHQRLLQRSTRNLAAFDEYMKGLYIFSQPQDSPDWIDRCAEHMQKAAALDPGFGEPIARLSRLEANRFANWLGDPELFRARALKYGAEAVRVSPDSGFCNAALAMAYVHNQRYDDAVAAAVTASACEPGSPEVMAIHGLVVAQGGDLISGRALLESALRAEKLVNPIYAWASGMVFFATAEYSTGRDALVDLLSKVPRFLAGNVLLAAHYAMLGQDTPAADQIRFVISRAPDMANTDPERAAFYCWRDHTIRDRLREALLRAYAVAGIPPPL